MKARLLAFVFIISGFFLVPFHALAQNAEVISQNPEIEKALPGYTYYNVSRRGNQLFFFAFDPENQDVPFAWYRLNVKASAKPKRIFSSSEFSLLFQVAVSEDGKHALALSRTGEIWEANLAKKNGNGKARVGIFTKRFSHKEFARFKYPIFTPDSRYLLLHDLWENTLIILDAIEKDVSKGKVIEGFWLRERGGGELPEKGSNISVYEFFDGGKKVRFGGNVLNLETLTKE